MLKKVAFMPVPVIELRVACSCYEDKRAAMTVSASEGNLLILHQLD